MIKNIYNYHLISYTSASRDARKMYGDLTPGDQTHQDAILLYQNHFKEAFHKMPSSFKEQSKYKVWQMCANIMQVCFKFKKILIYCHACRIALMKKRRSL